MNILHIVDERWDSGIVNYALTLAKGQMHNKHNVFVALKAKKAPVAIARTMGLSVIEIKGLWSWCRLFFFCITKKIDIINAHTGRAHAWAAMCALGKTRVIRTRGDARVPATSFLKKIVVSNTNRIIAPARFIQQGYKNIYPYFPARMITVVPQGIDHAEFAYFPEPSDAKGIRLGIVGRLDPVKGHRFLIKALASVKSQFPNIKLFVVGREENISTQELKSYADSLGLSREIEFSGHIADVKEIMLNCHIGIISSISSEAVSRSVLEWMSTGRAVVATKVGGIPDLISHELTGLLVNPAESFELAEAIKRLISDPEMRKRIAKYARKSIETTHSLKQFISRTEAVYTNAIESPSC